MTLMFAMSLINMLRCCTAVLHWYFPTLYFLVGMENDTQQRADLTLYLTISLLILAWLTMLLRLWVRLRITKSPGWDDALMVLTLILFTCYCSFIVVINLRGGFVNLPTADALARILLYIQLSETFYILTTTTLKISLGLFFLRVLTRPWQKLIFRIILGASAVYGVFYFFIAVFHCGAPGKLIHNITMNPSKCLPSWFSLTIGYMYGVINVVADWTFVLIPISVLLNSDMDRRSKISVSIVMAFGATGSISSILRMVYLKGLVLPLEYPADAVRTTIWATSECGTGIAAASMAILRPLVRKINHDVRDKISKIGSTNAFDSTHTTGEKQIRHNTFDNEDAIALTSVVTTITSKPQKKASRNPVPSPADDAWDTNILIERTQIAKVINVRMTTEEVPPPPPPKN